MQPHERTRWRLVETPPAPGAWNMAVDQALADTVREGGAPVLRVYRWSPACLSLGRSQPSDGYDRDEIRRRGLDVVRRPTGGRAVLHHRELTYSAAVREDVLGGPRPAYAAINRALVDGLRRLGVPAQMQPGGARAPVPSLVPCFEQPVEGEVTAGGRKLVGSAQRREQGVLLQHGSLLIHDDQSAVPRLMRPGAAVVPAEPPATLACLLGREPAWEEIVEALAAGWETGLNACLGRTGLTVEEERRAKAYRERYEDPAWTWHR
ncbi:MAG TPA: lipoate--protein ligase family protein [Longimicrobium sp.]|nr:lipoate--protein ligase family protein [Longimicrobium sp.]